VGIGETPGVPRRKPISKMMAPSIGRGPKASELRSVVRLSKMMGSEEAAWGMRTRTGMVIRKKEMMLRIEDNMMGVCE
jgi:hypothetical protein